MEPYYLCIGLEAFKATYSFKIWGKALNLGSSPSGQKGCPEGGVVVCFLHFEWVFFNLMGSGIYRRVIFLVSTYEESVCMEAVIAKAINAVWGGGVLVFCGPFERGF